MTLNFDEQCAADYKEFRGRCKELSLLAIKNDPTLTLVRGHYFCPYWSREEPHWWTVKADGTIHDPSARQFPSKGFGEYTVFDGTVECDECGKEVLEKDASFDSNYAFCSHKCHGRFIGVY